MRRARVQGSYGGVIITYKGSSAMFDSVAISDTSAAKGVRATWEGRSGRRQIGAAVCRTVAWRGYLVGLSSSRAAASHALRRCAILVADSCVCRMEVHGVGCTSVAWCVVHVAMCGAHSARMFDVARCSVCVAP
jgi:hypothetical protein